MFWLKFTFVAVGAMLGAWLRWFFGILFNPLYPTLPLGTLTANIVGGFLMGLFMELTKNHLFLSEAVRLGIATGFLGGLTTFSTFSAETVTLLSHHSYVGTLAIIAAHLLGSISATLLGIFCVKTLASWLGL